MPRPLSKRAAEIIEQQCAAHQTELMMQRVLTLAAEHHAARLQKRVDKLEAFYQDYLNRSVVPRNWKAEDNPQPRGAP